MSWFTWYYWKKQGKDKTHNILLAFESHLWTIHKWLFNRISYTGSGPSQFHLLPKPYFLSDSNVLIMVLVEVKGMRRCGFHLTVSLSKTWHFPTPPVIGNYNTISKGQTKLWKWWMRYLLYIKQRNMNLGCWCEPEMVWPFQGFSRGTQAFSPACFNAVFFWVLVYVIQTKIMHNMIFSPLDYNLQVRVNIIEWVISTQECCIASLVTFWAWVVIL